MNPGQLAARWLTAAPARTALIGTGVGAAAGALTAEPGDRLRGAMRGGLLGGGVGLAGGAAGRAVRDTRLLHAHANPGVTLSTGQAIGQTATRAGEGLTNFAKRQVHGLTGAFHADKVMMPGNARSARAAHLTQLRAADQARHAAPASRMSILQRGDRAAAAEVAHGAQQQELRDAGIMTVPGLVRGLAGPDRGKTMRALGKGLGTSALGVTAGVGLPLAFHAPGLLRGNESAVGGPTTGQKLRRATLDVGAGIATAGMPFGAQMLIGSGVQRLNSPRPRTLELTS
jgi:hypothetical protein